MNVGPPRIAMIIATSAATRTLCHYALKFSATASSPTDERALDEHDVPGPQRALKRGGSLGGRRDPLASVGACELADSDHVLDAELANEPRRSPRGTQARSAPSSAISPSTAMRRRPFARSARCSQRSPHRHRVRVVTVVQEQAAARQLALFFAQLRELDAAARSSGSGHAEALGRRDAPMRVFASWCAAEYVVVNGSGAAGSTRLTTMSRAVEVRLEQRLRRHDRDAADRKRRRSARPSPSRRSRSCRRARGALGRRS